MSRRVSANSQGSPRSTLDREQGVHAPYATVIVDKLVSRGLGERTAYDSHPLTEKVPNLCRPAPAVMSCASAVAGNDRTRLSYVSAARTPFPRRRQAAGRDRLPWLWYRCDTVGQQVRISILAGQSRFARPAGFEPATRCLEGSCSVRLSYGRSEIIVPGEYHASATYGSQCVAPPTTRTARVYEQDAGRDHFADLSRTAYRGRTAASAGRPEPHRAGRHRSLPRCSRPASSYSCCSP